MDRRKIYPGEIAVGQRLPWDVYDGRGVLLLSTGQFIETQDGLERLLEEGLYTSGIELDRPAPDSALQQIVQAYYKAENLLIRPEAASKFPNAVLDIANVIYAAALRAPDVVVATVLLRRDGQHSVRHVVDTACIVAIVLATQGTTPVLARSILAAALTMNIGCMELHEALARQEATLTPSQQARIASHPLLGAERLTRLGVTDSIWLNAVEQHHEHTDGSGYPQRLRRNQICEAAQLLCLADFFCARIRERDYRPGDSTRVILRDILLQSGNCFDAKIAAFFIKALGIYPIGTIVLLANNEIAVVTKRSDKIDAPWVRLLTRIKRKLLITEQSCLTDTVSTRIVEVLNPQQVAIDINMEALWGPEARDFDLIETDTIAAAQPQRIRV